MFQVSVLQCVSCGSGLSGTEKDRVMICKNCQTANEYGSGVVRKVRVTSVPFPGNASGERVYVPFWVVTADITITSENIAGGKILGFLKGEHPLDGRRRLWIAAADIPEELGEELGIRYSKTPPESSDASQPAGITRRAVICDHEEATQIAEYLFLKFEVKRSGTLQSIDYTMSFSDYELVYVPFEKKGESLKPLV